VAARPRDADQYEVINLEALAPEDDPAGQKRRGRRWRRGRYDVADLRQLRASMGEKRLAGAVLWAADGRTGRHLLQ
jgi:hypothetical protein